MVEVIREYAGLLLATAGVFLFLAVIGQIILSNQGLFMQMIAAYGNGGC